MDKHEKPKKYVLIRMKVDGNCFMLDRQRWAEFTKKAFYRGAYEAEVIAESDDTVEIMRFKSLTEEA
jgi:hypothetical protein